MSAREGGGPAFPVISGKRQISEHEWEYDTLPGATLRDWFAAMASEEDIEAHRFASGNPPGSYYNNRQEARYAHADAMLSARAGKPEGGE